MIQGSAAKTITEPKNPQTVCLDSLSDSANIRATLSASSLDCATGLQLGKGPLTNKRAHAVAGRIQHVLGTVIGIRLLEDVPHVGLHSHVHDGVFAAQLKNFLLAWRSLLLRFCLRHSFQVIILLYRCQLIIPVNCRESVSTIPSSSWIRSGASASCSSK